MACLFGTLPALLVWGEKGLVPTQRRGKGHIRRDIFTEELYRHLCLVEEGIMEKF